MMMVRAVMVEVLSGVAMTSYLQPACQPEDKRNALINMGYFRVTRSNNGRQLDAGRVFVAFATKSSFAGTESA
jgi:hypothetical protein